MQAEYLLFNLIVISGPLALSFEHRINFISKYRFYGPAIMIPAIVFIAWDIAVANSHWYFSELYTMPALFGLPPGEYLFFITIPYATLFVWENVKYYGSTSTKSLPLVKPVLAVIFFTISLYGLAHGQEYTAIVFTVMAIVVLLYFFYPVETMLSQRSLLVFLFIITALMFVFNGYLTSRPLVTYNAAMQFDFRLYTIPIEDFFYGYALIWLNVFLYEKARERFND
jgi:lycopene cyclase domain-containing protein